MRASAFLQVFLPGVRCSRSMTQVKFTPSIAICSSSVSGRLQLYAMADGDIPLNPCKQPFKECEIRRYDQPESAKSGHSTPKAYARTRRRRSLVPFHICGAQTKSSGHEYPRQAVCSVVIRSALPIIRPLVRSITAWRTIAMNNDPLDTVNNARTRPIDPVFAIPEIPW